MTTVLNRDSIQAKREIQKRVEDYVIKYCEALEENFKQHSINSYKRNIESPTSVSKLVINHTMKSNFKKLKMVQQILYKFDYEVGKKYIKVFNLQYSRGMRLL